MNSNTSPPKSTRKKETSAKTTRKAEQPDKRNYHHGNLRDTLVEHGLHILEAEGLASLSLRQLAQRVGVSQTAPLHHFEGKLGLLAAIAAEGFRRLFEYRMKRLKGLIDPRERLMVVMLAYVEFANEHPNLFHLMFGPEIPSKAQFPDLEQAATRSYGILETCVADYLIACGKPLDTERTATLAAWTACHGLATILVDRQNTPRDILRRDPDRIAKEVFGIFTDALARR
jgi:AcrR family transcriptional regulator